MGHLRMLDGWVAYGSGPVCNRAIGVLFEGRQPASGVCQSIGTSSQPKLLCQSEADLAIALSPCPIPMHIIYLFAKRQKGHPLEAAESLTLRRGLGIVGDVNAAVGSPRQVLIASQPVLQSVGLAPGYLRENILTDGLVETLPSGQVVQMGKTALVRLTFLCEPCAQLDRAQPGLSRRLHRQRGYLGRVVRDGVIHLGDEIRVLPYALSPMPNEARDRFHAFVSRIPQGRVVRTSDLLLALGLTSGYYRAIPRWMTHAPPNLPVHRIVSARGELMTRHLPDQGDRLQAEGITVVSDRVCLDHLWPAADYFTDGLPDEVLT